MFVIITPFLETTPFRQEENYCANYEPYFIPKDMTLGDDGFGADLPLHLETWYYEAIFSNNWSAVLIITVLAGGMCQQGLALVGLYCYNQGLLITAERTVTREFTVSVAGPECTINNHQIITANTMANGLIRYQIAAQMNKCQLNIIMINQTRGWQGDMGKGWWLAVPRLAVEGILVVGEQEMAVTGTGYHDHNRFALVTPIMEYGYMDGKMSGHDFSLVWGYIMHSSCTASSFMIYSEDGAYRALYPPLLNIELDDYVYDHGQNIPTICRLQFSDNELTISMTMRGVTFHHIRLPGLRYWRYHVDVKGYLDTPLHKITINEQGMMERMQY
jgi:hypothetical protein